MTLPGIKPVGVMQQVFESFYLYAVVEPLTGESLVLEFSHFDTACFQVFLEELSRVDQESLLIVLLDNAGVHKAKVLRVPDNLILLALPAYAPQLNPVERVWQYLKDPLAWQIFADLDALKHEVYQRIRAISSATFQSLTSYEDLLHAVNAL